MDKVDERIASERTGTRLYDALMVDVQALQRQGRQPLPLAAQLALPRAALAAPAVAPLNSCFFCRGARMRFPVAAWPLAAWVFPLCTWAQTTQWSAPTKTELWSAPVKTQQWAAPVHTQPWSAPASGDPQAPGAAATAPAAAASAARTEAWAQPTYTRIRTEAENKALVDQMVENARRQARAGAAPLPGAGSLQGQDLVDKVYRDARDRGIAAEREQREADRRYHEDRQRRLGH